MESETSTVLNLRYWRMRIDVNDRIYSGLKKLKLRGKELDNPPREIFLLTELQVLDLSPERKSCLFYHLPCVPPGVARLHNLRVLMLDTNELTFIPPEISMLTGLQKLSLSNNALSELPDGFSKLVHLSSLHAANNNFALFPRVICDLKALTFLDFSDNCLGNIPESIGELTNLESLLLYANNLEFLPDAICKLTALRCFWIGQNRIRRLPRGIENLRMLDWGHIHIWSLALDGNPLDEPPLEICKQGMQAIAEHFRNTVQGQ